MNPTYDNITGQKPFETAVGEKIMGMLDGSGLYVTPCNKPATYDFSFTGVMGKVTKYEVKNDDASAQWGNWYVEFMFKGKPSCIASTTAATWVHYMPKQEMLGICDVNELRTYISGCKPRIKAGGDDDLTRGYILPIKSITGQSFVGLIPFTFEQ